MKRASLCGVLALMIVCAVRVPASAGNAAMNAAINKMKKLVYQPMDRWQLTKDLPKEQVLDMSTPSGKFQKAGIGYFWADKQEVWIRTRYEVPESILGIPIKGTKISMSANVEDWGEIYVNGELKQTFRRSTGFVPLTESAVPGERYFIAMKLRRKDRDTGLIRDINLEYEALKSLETRVAGFVEAASAVDVLLEASGEDAAKWQPTLEQAAAVIDIEALRNGDLKPFYATLEKSEQILQPLSDILKKYSMFLVGYSHIDPAWMWDKAEGEHVVVRGTSEQILELQDEFPDFIYAANQMHCYRWMERDYPDLFARIKEAVKSGRWEPAGAQWVEPDGNLPHGESFVRQFLYGRKYSIEKFGFASTIGLTPDSFGYNWSLPQILSKSGMRGFVTQKISWNDTTRFPHNLFWWESPDGSRILMYFPQGSYGERVEAGAMAQQLSNMKKKHGVDSNLVLFGIGDHGGGIPRDYVKRAMALRTNPLYPKIEFLSLEQVFDRMLEKAKTLDFPVWKSELYLEYHRGTYTTQANTKNNNRRNEHCLMNAEKFASAAAVALDNEYPFDRIEEAWKILLFNQFHDILPGSSITPVYEDADKDHAWIAAECQQSLDAALESIAANADTTGPGRPAVIFNGLSWPRGGLTQIPVHPDTAQAAVFDDKGQELPAQIVTTADGGKAAAFVARGIPALGFAVYRVIEGQASAAAPELLKVDATTLENDALLVKIDPKTGWVSSIYDKKNKREAVAPGGAAFELQAYQEDGDSSDAWDMRFPADGGRMEMSPASKISIVENGPVRVTIMAERPFAAKSAFRQYYSLVAGLPVAFARLDADWHDSDIFLKSAFAMNMDADFVTYEIPYANIKRVTRPSTPAEKAQWEVSGHRWADYTANKGDYGATLLSWSKYGYDARGNVLRMTMLRSPTRPDPLADRHAHSIPYALFPHAGDWRAADSARLGREYNDPLRVLTTFAHEGSYGKSRGFFSLDADNAAIETIKRAEDGDGFILRIVETEGRDGTVTIALPAVPKRAAETDLTEKEIKPLSAAAGAALTVPLGHYEIKTVRVAF
jgi:alpha-mannosidase